MNIIPIDVFDIINKFIKYDIDDIDKYKNIIEKNKKDILLQINILLSNKNINKNINKIYIKYLNKKYDIRINIDNQEIYKINDNSIISMIILSNIIQYYKNLTDIYINSDSKIDMSIIRKIYNKVNLHFSNTFVFFKMYPELNIKKKINKIYLQNIKQFNKDLREYGYDAKIPSIIDNVYKNHHNILNVSHILLKLSN